MRKLLATAVLTAISFNANAFPVEWTLNNFVFEDGGIATGSFTYDADTYSLSNILIVTSGGSTPGNTYDNEIYALSAGNHYGGTLLVFMNQSRYPMSIQFEFSEALTNAGGIISFDEYTGEVCQHSDCSYDRILVSGTVSAVPVPAAVWLFGSALAGLGFMRRRKTA